MMTRVLFLLVALLTVALPASAQPPGIVVSSPSLEATAAVFTITWSGGGAFDYTGGYNDGSGAQQGIGASSPLTLRIPYHATGVATTGWVCVSSSFPTARRSR